MTDTTPTRNDLLPNRYTKKPVTIEAFQLTEEVAISNLIDEVPLPFGLGRLSGTYHPKDRTVSCWRIGIDTLEGRVTARENDWIIKGVQGELYPCKPDIFEVTYNAATQSPKGVDVPNFDGYEPFVYDPATGFFHADDGGAPEHGARWVREDAAPTAQPQQTEEARAAG